MRLSFNMASCFAATPPNLAAFVPAGEAPAARASRPAVRIAASAESW